MRFWFYKCNVRPNGTGTSGDWLAEVFSSSDTVVWPGHSGSGSAEVHRALDERMSVGDVVVAFQTNRRAIMGMCRVNEVVGDPGAVDLVLAPIHCFATPFRVHEARVGTSLERCGALIGRVALRELTRDEMVTLVDLSGAPKRVLRGRAASRGYVAPGSGW
jgi:hypothetical protein